MKIGDRVRFNGKYGLTDGKIYTVTSNVWEVGDKQLVRLNGKKGGWLIDGLEIVNESEDELWQG